MHGMAADMCPMHVQGKGTTMPNATPNTGGHTTGRPPEESILNNVLHIWCTLFFLSIVCCNWMGTPILHTVIVAAPIDPHCK